MTQHYLSIQTSPRGMTYIVRRSSDQQAVATFTSKTEAMQFAADLEEKAAR